MSQPIGADFPEHFDIAATAVFLFEVCQKRQDWEIRIVSEHKFEGFSGFSLWQARQTCSFTRHAHRPLPANMTNGRAAVG